MHMRAVVGFMFVLSVAFSGTAVDGAEPGKLRVFILAGQSNMEGHGVIEAEPKRNGGKGSLEYLVRDEKTRETFGRLVDDQGKWVVRDDVWIWYLGRAGGLTVGYGVRPDRMGPELGFGVTVGERFDEPVLLIKTAWGGKSLAIDFRSPSAGKIPQNAGEKLAAKLEAEPDTVGHYYRLMLSHVHDVLKNVKQHFPEYDGRGYEIAGFAWHQGWNDRVNQAFNDEYEQNLAHFIRDVRRDLGVQNLPFVIAETGMSGHAEKHPRALSLMRAQAAVAKFDQFQGNVAFVGTKDFFRPKEESPSGQAYHWNTNAETYFLIGQAMGQAMIKLMEPKAD